MCSVLSSELKKKEKTYLLVFALNISDRYLTNHDISSNLSLFGAGAFFI